MCKFSIAHLIGQKAFNEIMIGLTTGVSVMKMLVVNDFVLETIEIDGNDIDLKIDLIQ